MGASHNARDKFPDEEWNQAEPRDLGFDSAMLDRLAVEAQAGGANCLLVVRHGRVAGEWYWNGSDASSAHQVFSITKSYTSTLVGIAQDEGLLDIDAAASKYIPEWAGTPSQDVTVRQMLGMVSGRDPVAVVHQDQAMAYFGAADMTAYTLDRRQVHPPGSVWALNEGDIQPLGAILEAVAGVRPDVYAAAKLFGPIGARHTTMAKDGAGNTIMDAFTTATGRDVARLGHLFLHQGDWDGVQVVSPDWVQDATGHPSQDIFSGYGLLWWLNRPGGADLDRVDPTSLGDIDLSGDQLLPGAPEDIFLALGAYGQVLQVHPATGTVVVRLGAGPSFFDTEANEVVARIVTDAVDTD